MSDEPRIVVTRREICEQVVLRTDICIRDVRDVLEACFEVSREALGQGYDVQMSPLGRIKPITRVTENGEAMHYKLVLSKT